MCLGMATGLKQITCENCEYGKNLRHNNQYSCISIIRADRGYERVHNKDYSCDYARKRVING